MSLYKIKIKVASPLQISDIVIGNVLKQSGTFCLQSSTVRGGILSKIYREQGVKEVIEESKDTSINFHPAYPVDNGIISRPPHILLHKCKICEGGVFINKVLQNKKLLKEFNFERFDIPYKCSEGHLFAISPVKSLVIFKDSKYKEINIKKMQLESIGMNRALSQTELGMIYSYITIRPGVIFDGLIYDPKDKIEKLLGYKPKNEYIRVGRGISRGMGITEFEFEEVNYEKYIEKRASEIKDAILKTEGIVILRALTPILSMDKAEFSYKIDLSEYGLQPMEVFNGVNYLTQSPEILKGYSVYTNLPKIEVKGLGSGTLYFYKIENKIKIDEISMLLSEFEIKGFAHPFNVGLNIMEVYTDVGKLL
ncbi:MAG: hypothetical protein QXY79_03420 [Candidatus Methanomethylicia archaeon]